MTLIDEWYTWKLISSKNDDQSTPSRMQWMHTMRMMQH